MIGRWPLHAALLVVFPVLFLWSQNTTEVVAGDVWPVLARVVLAAAVVFGVAAAAYRNVAKAALFTSAAAVLTLTYGHVAGAVPPLLGLAVLVALLAGVTLLIRAAGPAALRTTTAFTNVIAIALVATTLLPLASEATSSGGGIDDASVVASGDGPRPDIYYVILDRYGRDDSLRELFGYDNSDFTQFLVDHGFDVAEQSVANYPKTAHSLASSLNLSYLDELETTVPASAQSDYEPVYALLRNHRVGEALTDLGYRYLHLGTWWSPTATAASADEVLTYDQASEFAQVFSTTTAWPAVQRVLGIETALDQRELRRRHSEHQLDTLEQLASQDHDEPVFVFAHITLPHEPFVFEADGSWVPADVEASRSRAENFVPQLQYLNSRLRTIVERLTTQREGDPAIVVLQADEGPTPERSIDEGWDYLWADAPDAELREKFQIFNAYSLPGVTDADIPEDITPVNTFRLILRRYFGAELEPLGDRAYVYPRRAELYRFIEITDRVR